MGAPLPDDGDDRDTGAGPRARVADRAAVERRSGVEREPVHRQPLDVPLELGELLRDLGDAEELRERPRVLGSEADQIVRRVRVVALVQDELADAGPVMDHAEPDALLACRTRTGRRSRAAASR